MRDERHISAKLSALEFEKLKLLMIKADTNWQELIMHLLRGWAEDRDWLCKKTQG